MEINKIQDHLDAILEFMQPYWGLINCHMNNYLTESFWEKYMPPEVQLEIDTSSKAHDCIIDVFWHGGDKQNIAKNVFPNTRLLIEKISKYVLENSEILTKFEELCDADSNANRLSIKEFMSDKKCHEVESTALLTDNLIRKYAKNDNSNEVFVIDAGDGKGYLSSRLAMQYGYKVLGIDAEFSNTRNALERNKKLQRSWNGLVRRTETLAMEKTNKSPICNTVNHDINYRTTALFIEPHNVNVTELIHQHFPETFKDTKINLLNVCLVGLHTCGNLSATCMRIFHTQPNCKILCNIGCCYHLLHEHFAEDSTNEASTHTQASLKHNASIDFGFPLSKFLLQRKICIGRNGRMLAQQSVERSLTTKELPSISLHYRALLEVLFQQKQAQCSFLHNSDSSIKVGKIRKFSNFQNYIELCAKKTKHPVLMEITSTEIHQVLSDFQNSKYYLDLFYYIRMQFAPILESIILLDRLLYLKELGHNKSYLVSIFDPVVSPRHYGIIALKQ